jgi:RND family efflux transporter MFP subunit
MIKKTICYSSFLLLVVSGCKQKDIKNTEVKENAIPVQTEIVKSVVTNDVISVSGNIEGNSTVRLGFMVAGKIDFIAYKEGQNISKGQLISSLDPSNYNLAKEMADVQVNSASDEFNRLKIMHDRNSISDGDFSKISFALQQAKVQQKLQVKNVSDTKLFSPITGVLLKKIAEVGEIVGIGTPLFVISDIKKVKVIAYIPEGELHNIRLGQNAKILITALNKYYEGKVIEVGSAADATSRAFTVKIELENTGLLIRPGMIAEVTLPSNLQKEIISIPTDAVLNDLDNQSYVFVIDTTNSKAFKRKISIGNIINNRITVIAGLKEGEAIVIAGQGKLNDASSIINNK